MAVGYGFYWFVVYLMGNITMHVNCTRTVYGGVHVFEIDLFTGMIHYSADAFDEQELPFLGPLVATFHGHHYDPSFLARVSFVIPICELLLSQVNFYFLDFQKFNVIIYTNEFC